MLQLLYEDGDVVAVDKPSGISSIPERDPAVPSVITMLQEQLGHKLFIVHRLDKEVSGVLLFAKTAAVHRLLNAQFLRRTVRKCYRALVHGVISEEGGTIDKPIRQFGSGRMGVDEKTGKPSTTAFEVQVRYPARTALDVFPLTGRRHQIRVHLYAIGHPIAGDALYGDKSAQKDFPRLMLHAQRITFVSAGEKEISVSSPVPQEFSAPW